MGKMIGRWLSASGFAVSSLIVAFGLAWIALYALNFSYGRWHDVGHIGAAIDKYGPQNYYRSGFGETTKAQRVQLFAEINYAVHRDGKGLDKIVYTVAGHPTQTLLTTDEVLHLTDVAHLINKVRILVVGGFVLWVLLILYYYRQSIVPPSVLRQLVAVLFVIALFIVVLLIVGPAQAFSKMHEWVFPPGNPWFFYYQHSLMSTMMWAPRLFAWISAEWAVFTVVFFTILQFSISRLIRRVSSLG